jgi:hypothetical protein
VLAGIRGEIAELYRAFWPTLKPYELDAMELWQIAVVMGLDVEPEKLQGPPVPTPRPDGSGPVASGPRLRAVR